MSITVSDVVRRLGQDIGVEPDGEHATLLTRLLCEGAVAMFADCPWLRLQDDGSMASVSTAAAMQTADSIAVSDVEEEPLKHWAAARFFASESGDRNDKNRARSHALAYVSMTGGLSPIGG